ncbi:MAG TPA: type ISP restriction/modification enzyme [Pyrinomonadaceae bacterium]
MGLDAKTAVRIKEIKQLRPLVTNQPWGIFYINFEPKLLPIVVLRRILRSLVIKKRASASRGHQAAWKLNDLLFISSYGETDERAITFAHFSDSSEVGDLPTLKVLGWDAQDTVLHLEDAHRTLREKLRFPADPSDVEAWREQWSSAFRLRHREVVTTSIELARRLAELATLIRERANRVLAVESEKGAFRSLREAFREALIHDLSADDFADMYAQTIAYGLLSARVSRPAGLVADNLLDMVPSTNPFLKELLGTFLKIGGRDAGGANRKANAIDFDELGINEVVELLRRANMDAVLRDFGNRNPTEDPVIHFYELFLKEYDPVKRMRRGVFYTPRPVVSFIVRSVDEILRREFKLEYGLADTTTWREMAERHEGLQIPEGISPDAPFVQVLDPATGTSTFIVETIDLIYNTMVGKWRGERKSEKEIRELWNDYVPKHLLPRVYGFELMMAPYAIAHMKIGLKLYETGYSFLSSERARIYLTNTLEEPKDFSGYFVQMAPALAHEAAEANTIKRRTPITVVIGNPPYSSLSQNLTPTARELISRYKFIDGQRIVERGALQLEKNLQDDYIKFLARSQDFLSVPNLGVLCLITNHGFIDNPTLRGFRWSILRTFERTYVLDLHGNVNRRELTAQGEPDQNVFDIKDAGVAVVLGLSKNIRKEALGELYHQDLWGDRKAEKNPFLLKEDVQTVGWNKPVPTPDLYMFKPMNYSSEEEYRTAAKVTEIFPLHSIGIITARDHYVIDFEPEPILERAKKFQKSQLSDVETCKQLGIPLKKGWNVARARQRIKAETDLSKFIKPLLYRPFDIRPVFYHESLIWGMARPVMQHMIGGKKQPNLALITSRMTKGETFQHALVSRTPSEVILLSSKTSNNAFAFPLYIYDEKSSLLKNATSAVRRANFAPQFVADLAARLKLLFHPDGRRDPVEAFTPEDVFHYVYAILHSPAYRKRYGEFLKVDFPRVPLTTDRALFRALCQLGANIVALHLLEEDYADASWNRDAGSKAEGEEIGLTDTNPLASDVVRFHDAVGRQVVKGFLKYDGGKVHINAASYFEGISEAVWNFHIGGYQVAHKWLKERRGRTLSPGDITHYARVCHAVAATLEHMSLIDEVIEAHGGFPLVGSQDTAPVAKEAASSLPFD